MEPVVEKYRDQKKKDGAPLTLLESQDLLVQLLNEFPQTTICVDALDEVDSETRINLLKALKYVIQESKNLVKIFATSRHDPDILKHFEIFPRIEIQPDDNIGDINLFITRTVRNSIVDNELLCGECNEQLAQDICQALRTRSKGM